MHASTPIVTFGIISDLQYADAESFKNRYYRNSLGKLEKVIDHLNGFDLDFVINLGDMIDQDWKSYDKILPYFSRIKAPVHHALGNHDYEVSDEKIALVASRIGTDQYYDFSMKGWRFIVLDGNEISTFAHVPDNENYLLAQRWLVQMESDEKVNANFWNGGIGKNQLEWLETVLNNASQKGEKVLIFCHYPIFPTDKHNLLNDEELLRLLKNYKSVKSWINGHNHKGNYGLFEGIHFVNVKGMVEGENDMSWSVVELSDNLMSISGFGNEISARLNY